MKEATNSAGLDYSVSADGTLTYLARGAATTTQLTWVDRSGKDIGHVGERALYSNPEISPDGTRVALGMLQGSQWNIWVIELARGVARRLTFDRNFDVYPLWSPDGSRIVFSSEAEGGATTLYQVQANGAGKPERLLKAERNRTTMSLSPDGRVVLFEMPTEKGPAAFWTMPLSGDRQPTVYLETQFNQGTATFSPDGRWVAYNSDETGRPEVYVQSFPTPGAKLQVSAAGGADPRWRRDGKELYYVTPEEKLAAVSVTLGSTVELGTPAVLFEAHLANINVASDRPQYDVAPDGRRFLVNAASRQTQATPVTVILNWTSALKK